MTRKVDELGRIVLPVEMRSRLHIKKDDVLNVEYVGGKIILSRVKPSCVICHSEEHDLFTVDQTLICSECIKKIKLFCY